MSLKEGSKVGVPTLIKLLITLLLGANKQSNYMNAL